MTTDISSVSISEFVNYTKPGNNGHKVAKVCGTVDEIVAQKTVEIFCQKSSFYHIVSKTWSSNATAAENCAAGVDLEGANVTSSSDNTSPLDAQCTGAHPVGPCNETLRVLHEVNSTESGGLDNGTDSFVFSEVVYECLGKLMIK